MTMFEIFKYSTQRNRPPQSGPPLPGIQPLLLQLHALRALLHHLLSLCKDQFDVAGV